MVTVCTWTFIIYIYTIYTFYFMRKYLLYMTEVYLTYILEYRRRFRAPCLKYKLSKLLTMVLVILDKGAN